MLKFFNYLTRALLVFCILLMGCGKGSHYDISTPEGIRAALKNEPYDTAALFARANLFISEKKFDSALVDMQSLLRIDSARADYYIRLGDIYFFTNQTRYTRDAFEKALKINPANELGHMKLAELYLYVQMYKESLKHLDEVLKLNKHNPKAYYMKGIVFKEAGDTAMAMSSFLTTTEQNPEYMLAFEQLGIIYAANHDKRAIDFFKSALRIQPKNTQSLYNLGLFYQQHGEPDKAIETYRELLEIDPAYVFASYNIGYIYLILKNNPKEAISWFENAIKRNPGYKEAYYMKGLCLEDLRKKNEATEAYKQCLSIDPDFQLAKDALSKIPSH